MYLRMSNSNFWSGAGTKFSASRYGSGTIEKVIKFTDGSKQTVLMEEEDAKKIDNLWNMDNIYFNILLREKDAISVHVISNDILSHIRGLKCFLFGFNSFKYSVLFSKDQFSIINKNSFKFNKNYKELDLSSSKKFLTSVNSVIFKHELSRLDTDSTYHNMKKNILLANNFTDLELVYNQIMRRKYYV